MTTNEKLALLRAQMAKAGVNACIVPSSDPHMSEYLPAHWRARAHFSGFDGSAGTLVVTEKESGIWTDGRYFIQAQNQINGSEIVLYRMGEKNVPTTAEFLAEKLGKGQVLGLDGMVNAAAEVERLEKAFAGKEIEIKSVDLVANAWENRPAIPTTQAFLHETRYTGLSGGEKLNLLRAQLEKSGGTATVVSGLPDVCWLLNIRADDVVYTPYLVGYCFVNQTEAVLFADASRIPKEVIDNLAQNGVKILPYDGIIDFIVAYQSKETLLLDKANTNYQLYLSAQANPGFTIKEQAQPVIMLKAVKNETEIASLKNAHIKDGCALVGFQMELEEKMKKGEVVNENDIALMLVAHRSNQADYIGESFATIAAYGGNAAMMHYHATAEKCDEIQARGFLLVDSGVHFIDGTTDITRTFNLGNLTQEERELYTYVLKSHIGMARAVFMEGCSGSNLDILARSAIWRQGLDYRCGTGHGVGFVSGIHEGPQSMRMTNTVPFVPGMIITDEPGIYEEGKIGIRIENELLCVEHIETKYGKFFAFEPVTYFPIDLSSVDKKLLTHEEIAYINEYHALVFETLAPFLAQPQVAWLKEKTASI